MPHDWPDTDVAQVSFDVPRKVMPVGHKLRVGLLLNDHVVPAWAYEMVDILNESSYAEVVALIYRNKPVESPNRRKLVYRLYRKLDRRLFGTGPDAFERRDLRDLNLQAESVHCETRETKFSDYVDEESLARIRELRPDVLIRLGFRILRGEILTAPKYGVWSFHHGDNLVIKGGPPAFWEVMLGWPSTGSVLQILTEKLDDGRVIFRSWSQTDPLSVHRNANRLYWKSLFFIPRALEDLAVRGEEAIRARHQRFGSEEFVSETHELYKAPDNVQGVKLIGSLALRTARRKLRELNKNKQWLLMYGDRPSTDSLEIDVERMVTVSPPPDRFYADPFPATYDGREYVFFEELVFKEGKGFISVGEVRDGKFEHMGPALIEDYHLSYPFVFEMDGEWYMVPESAEANSIQLYRAVEFPCRWEKCRDLMDNVSAVDTTLAFRDDIWWMFTNIASHPGASRLDELHLFYTDDLLNGEWTPHPGNPIVSDVRRARMAGHVVGMNGRDYRPAQDCSRRYGYAVRLQRIEVWNRDEYREREEEVLQPQLGGSSLGSHTVNWSTSRVWMDAHSYRRKPFNSRG